MTEDETTFLRGRRTGGTLCSSPTGPDLCKSGRCWPTAAIRNSSRLLATIRSQTGVGSRVCKVGSACNALISLEGQDPTGMNRASQGAPYTGEKDETVKREMGRPRICAECGLVPRRLP